MSDEERALYVNRETLLEDRSCGLIILTSCDDSSLLHFKIYAP